jgi:hypothetical protein
MKGKINAQEAKNTDKTGIRPATFWYREGKKRKKSNFRKGRGVYGFRTDR